MQIPNNRWTGEMLNGTQTADALAGVFQEQRTNLFNPRRYPRRIVLHLTDGGPDNREDTGKAVRSLTEKDIHVAAVGIELSPGVEQHLRQAYPVWTNVSNVRDLNDAVLGVTNAIMHSGLPKMPRDPAKNEPVGMKAKGIAAGAPIPTQAQLNLAGARPSPRPLRRRRRRS